MASLNNPFVGPRPLTRDNPIFGRDREIAELRHLLTAERFVLLLSPSGAGKSSLVNAGLIPELNSRFDVWEPTRVNTPPPPGVTTNRYVWSTIHGWKVDGPETELAPFVAARPRRLNILLIFDQFEEILRLNPADTPGRTEFFRQLAELLQSPSIWALLVLREDYLAPLLPWLSRLPTHFRTRLRLGFLSPPSAAEAMHCTAATGGRQFQPDALRKLTARLADETGVIEPMHLQVVCRRLWERMPDDDLSIDGVDIDQFASVTTSLAEYYATSVAAIARQFEISERAIRDWFQKELITASQTRGQVQQGPECSGTLPTPVAEAFLQTHLIRVEPRRKDWWYELAHDRLLDPVFQSNDSWYRHNLNTTQQRAVLWIEQHKPDALLLGADDLPAALAWLTAAANPTQAERDFIDRSQRKYEAERESQRAAAREAALNLRLSALLARVAIKDGDSAAAAGNPEHALAHYVRALRFQPDLRALRFAITKTLLSQPWPILARSFPHPFPIDAIAVSPDFHTLAVSVDCELHETWNLNTAALLHSEIQTGSSRRPAFSADVNPCPDGSLRLAWNSAGPLFSGAFPFSSGYIESRNVHTRSDLQQLFLWDLSTGSLIASSPPELPRAQPELSSLLQIVASQRSLAAAPPPFIGRSLASLWNSHGTLIRQRSVCSARFLPDGRALETVDENGNLWFWDCPSGSPLRPSRLPGKNEIPLAISPNGRFSFMAGELSGVWDRIDRRFRQVRSLYFYGDRPGAIAVSPCGTHIANFSSGKYVELSSPDGPSGWYSVKADGPNADSLHIVTLQFSADGSSLLIVDSAGTLHLLDPATAEPLPAPSSTAAFHRFSIESPDRSRVLTVPLSPGNEAFLTTLSGEPVCSPIPHSGEIRDVAFSPDSQYFVIVAAGESSVQYRLSSTGAPLGNPLLHHEVVLSAISPSQELVAIESASGQLEVCSAASGSPVGSLVHFAAVDSVGFSPSGSHFFALSANTVQSWDSATCLPLSSPITIGLQGRPALLLSPDGTKLLAPFGFWDLQTSQFTEVPPSPHAERFPNPQTDHIVAVWDPSGSAILLAATITDDRDAALPPVHCVTRWEFNSPLPPSEEILLDSPPVAVACSIDAPYLAVVTRSGVARRFSSHSLEPAGPLVTVLPGAKSAALSPNGQSIVVTFLDGALGIWNLESGLQSPLALPDSSGTAAAYDTRGYNLVVSNPPALPSLWSLRLARPVRLRSSRPILAISPDASYVLTELPSGALERLSRKSPPLPSLSVGIPDLSTELVSPPGDGFLVTRCSRYLQIWASSPEFRLHHRLHTSERIYSARVSPDGRRLLVRSYDTGSRLYSLDGDSSQPIEPSAVPYWYSAAFSPDSSCLLLGGQSAPAEIYDTATFSPLPPALPHPAPPPSAASLNSPRFHTVTNAAFAHDSRCVLTAADRDARLWTIVRDLLPPLLPLPHDGPPRLLEFLPGSNLLLAATSTGWLHFWNWPSLTPAVEPRDFTAVISSLAVSPHGLLLVASPIYQESRPRWSSLLYGTDDLRFRYCNAARLVLFSPSGDLVLTLSVDGFLRLWLTLDGSPDGPSIRIRGDSPFRTAAFHPAGTFFAAGDHAGQVTVYSRNTLCPIPCSVTHQASVRIVAFSPSGELLLSASDDGTAHLTRFPGGTPHAPPIVHSRAIRSACFHPSGRRLLTASEDGTTLVWDVDTALPVSRPMKHQNTVTAAIFSPCGHLVATASLDGTASLWDAASGRPLAAFPHPAPVHNLRFSPDGDSLVTACEDGALRCWPLFIDSGSPADATLLASLAEAIAGVEVNDDGDIVSIPDPHAQLQQTAAAIASAGGLFARFLPRFLPDYLWK